jgi:aspartyl-tRNA(Asn)/glutamyl-tRNA(Gln) amidotransferase subunit A
MDDTPRLEDAGEIERTFSRQAWLVFNTLGVPAMTVPIGLSSAGLPFAMQIAGKPHDEATVLRIGYAYEQGAGHMPVLPALGSSG